MTKRREFTPEGRADWERQKRIRDAAPDMLKALKGAKTVIAMMERPEGIGDVVAAALDTRCAAIDAAIAKAEGRQE